MSDIETLCSLAHELGVTVHIIETWQKMAERTPWVQTVVAPLLVRRCCYGAASARHFCVVIGVG
ncbi:hypothetical protein CIP107524_00717 [Corynebacterium diphtheriae]|nr:hypothetical protein CIP107524_00717 [Corynebacterium diphtheriae]CAB0899028.1 hypothetical protein FRC0420_00831 [Corynebacterium diphtheriae]